MKRSAFKLALSAIICCTVWFSAAALLIMHFDLQTTAHTSFLVFHQYQDQAGPKAKGNDTIRFNDNFVLSQAYRGKDSVLMKDKTHEIFFNRNPRMLLWIFLIISLSSISFAFIAPLIGKIAENVGELNDKWKSFYILAGSFAFSTILFLLDKGNQFTYVADNIMGDLRIIFKYPHDTIFVLLLPVIIVGALCLSGIVLSAFNIYNLNTRPAGKNETIDAFRRIRSGMNFYLLILGILVASGSVVTTSALRRCLSQMLVADAPFELMPTEIVYVYSLMFTIFIIVVYVPSYYIMTNTGKAILDKLNPFSSHDLTLWNSNKAILEDHLGLKVSLKENLSNALVVISPLASALISQLLGK
jgi:hypothetical protein